MSIVGDVALLTDGQVAAIITALCGCASSAVVAFRWAVLRLVTSVDASTAERAAQRVAFARLEAKLEDRAECPAAGRPSSLGLAATALPR